MRVAQAAEDAENTEVNTVYSSVSFASSAAAKPITACHSDLKTAFGLEGTKDTTHLLYRKSSHVFVTFVPSWLHLHSFDRERHAVAAA